MAAKASGQRVQGTQLGGSISVPGPLNPELIKRKPKGLYYLASIWPPEL